MLHIKNSWLVISQSLTKKNPKCHVIKQITPSNQESETIFSSFIKLKLIQKYYVKSNINYNEIDAACHD